MYLVTNLPDTLYLDYRGENEVLTYDFDFSAWVNEYGNGTLTIRHKRVTDAHAYVVPSVTIEGNVATWTVTNTDNAVKGYGIAELWYMVGDKKKASALISTVVLESLAETGAVPDPEQDWLDQVTELKDDAEQARDDAEDFAQDAYDSAQDAANVFTFSDPDDDGNVIITRRA